VFRKLFSKKTEPLTGAPAVRRMKTYSAQSGYVYQYFYEGQRREKSENGPCNEFVFKVSADRKNWRLTSVLVSDAAVGGWEKAQGRELSSTERYAVAKMALFQAFDNRDSPDEMHQGIRVAHQDIAAILETLGL
jgi:hypothetical protein